MANVYATSDGESFEFNGSFETLGAAQGWAADRGQSYLSWWSDGEEEEERPGWTRCPADPPQA